MKFSFLKTSAPLPRGWQARAGSTAVSAVRAAQAPARPRVPGDDSVHPGPGLFSAAQFTLNVLLSTRFIYTRYTCREAFQE